MKTQTKHTPAKWHVIPNAAFDIKDIGRNPAYDPLPIATVLPTSRYSTPESDAEQAANARLIALAPEMAESLAALFEHCVMVHKHWGDDNNQRESDAAIKTAQDLLNRINNP